MAFSIPLVGFGQLLLLKSPSKFTVSNKLPFSRDLLLTCSRCSVLSAKRCALHSTILTLGTGYIRSSNKYPTVYPWLEFYTRSNYCGNFPSTFVFLCVWHSANHREVTLKNGVGPLFSLTLPPYFFPLSYFAPYSTIWTPVTGYLIDRFHCHATKK